MKSFVALALAATALAIPQSSTPPAGCQASVSGTFQITTVNVTSPKRRSLEARQLSTSALTLSLQNGNLKDQAGRIGYIASNYQFQFDNPVQAGARETSGFSLCSNGSLALNNGRASGAAVWFSCLSGNFYNLYSQSQGGQCIPIYILAQNQGGSGASQISDGQPQATTPGRVSQITDGQPQATSPGPRPISQISDGQPQASAPGRVSQISDGQPQAPRPASTTRAVVSQISDGQPQAPRPTSAPAVVSQISDGQPQAPRPTSRAPVVSQISDGQPQAPTPVRNATTSAPAVFTGAAATGNAAVGAFAAGLFGLFALL